MNDYLSGIMALAQMTPEQFDLGRQRFDTLRGLYGKNGFQSSAAMAGSNMVTQGPTSLAGGQFAQLNPDVLQKDRERQQRIADAVPAGFVANSALNPPNSSALLGQVQRVDEGYTNPQTGEQVFISNYGDSVGEITRRIAAPEGYQPRSSQPTMTPTQGVEGGFGTGPTPYRQPYYQSSFVNRNPYFSGYGMGYNAYMPQFGRVGTYGSRGKGGGYGGGYGGGFGSYGKGGGI
jgi:hypothetical protein